MKSKPPPKNGYQMVAATLRYNQAEGGVPVVSEIGDRETAALMSRIAKKYNVPVVCDPDLARELAAVGKKHPIPPRLYKPVAKLLVSCRAKREG